MGRRLLTDAHAADIVARGRAGTPYRPSNGTEGDMFIERHCRDCAVGEESCRILFDASVHEIDEDGYPAEWRYGPDGQPTCMAYRPADED